MNQEPILYLLSMVETQVYTDDTRAAVAVFPTLEKAKAYGERLRARMSRDFWISVVGNRALPGAPDKDLYQVHFAFREPKSIHDPVKVSRVSCRTWDCREDVIVYHTIPEFSPPNGDISDLGEGLIQIRERGALGKNTFEMYQVMAISEADAVARARALFDAAHPGAIYTEDAK